MPEELFELLDTAWKQNADLFSFRADCARALMFAGLKVLTDAADDEPTVTRTFHLRIPS